MNELLRGLCIGFMGGALFGAIITYVNMFNVPKKEKINSKGGECDEKINEKTLG